MALFTSSCLTQLPGFQKEGKKESSLIFYLEIIAAAPFAASGRRGKGGVGLLPRCPRIRTPLALISV